MYLHVIKKELQKQHNKRLKVVNDRFSDLKRNSKV